MLDAYFKYPLCFLDIRRIRMISSKNFFNLFKSTTIRQNIHQQQFLYYFFICPHTSLIRVSVWSISISPKGFLPIPFWEKGKPFLGFMVPLPLPAPETPPPRVKGFLVPRPGPGRPPFREIPGSSPSHLISSGDIYHDKTED